MVGTPACRLGSLAWRFPNPIQRGPLPTLVRRHGPNSKDFMWPVLSKPWADRRGQDLVEYALLGATLALAGFLVLSTMDNIINAVYTSWDAATQAIWEPEDPQ
jgi:Flp pilus assembly pilin Flp